MSQRSDRDAAGDQPAMFTYRADRTTRMVLGDRPPWQYPCGLCNDRLVSESGGLCSTCAPPAPRTRRKTSAKKTAPAKKAAKRVPPWDRVATGDQRGGGAS